MIVIEQSPHAKMHSANITPIAGIISSTFCGAFYGLLLTGGVGYG
jgi:hypothetical protein